MKRLKYLAAVLILIWWFVGWPPVWQNPRIPPRTQKAIAVGTSETFTSSGTFNAPVGIYSVTAECRGGGGAYAKTTGIGVTPSSGYSVVIGAGGSGGNVAAGLPGSNSTFDTNNNTLSTPQNIVTEF